MELPLCSMCYECDELDETPLRCGETDPHLIDDDIVYSCESNTTLHYDDLYNCEI